MEEDDAAEECVPNWFKAISSLGLLLGYETLNVVYICVRGRKLLETEFKFLNFFLYISSIFKQTPFLFYLEVQRS